MKKFIALLLSIVLLTICLVSCEEECDHSGSNWVVATPATCTEQGKESFDCSRCDYSDSRIIEPTGHSYKFNSSGVDVCDVCNNKSYFTYSAKALSKFYSDSGTDVYILNILAGPCTWENKSHIAVVIKYTEKKSDWVIVLFNVSDGTMIFDPESAIESELLQDEILMSNPYLDRETSIEILARRLNNLDKQSVLLSLVRNADGTLLEQDLESIKKSAQNINGISPK